jgi:hypothetical protein
MAVRSTRRVRKAKVKAKLSRRAPSRTAKAAKGRKTSAKAPGRAKVKPRPTKPVKEWGVLNVAPAVFQDALRHPESVFVRLGKGEFDQDGFEANGRRLIVRDSKDGRLAVGRAVATEPGGLTLGALYRIAPEYRLAKGEYQTGTLRVVMSPNLPPRAKFIVDRMR